MTTDNIVMVRMTSYLPLKIVLSILCADGNTVPVNISWKKDKTFVLRQPHPTIRLCRHCTL